MNNQLTTHNGFSMMPATNSPGAQALVAREVQEAQGALICAKMYPRNPGQALQNIEGACQRIRLAEQAMYSYPRGKTQVTGPSIRLAEVIAQNWGNIKFGYKEVNRTNGYSDVVARAWDLETNVERTIEFRVPHVRESGGQTTALSSERDIYEMVANQASRRVRNCILAVVPGDVVDAAIDACENTLTKQGDIEAKRAGIVKAFTEFGISAEEIELKFGKKITALTNIDYLQCRKIYQSIRDGQGKKEDWFKSVLDPEKIKKEQTAAATDAVKDEIKPPGEVAASKKEKESAINEFIKAYDDMKAHGGDPEKFLGKKSTEILIMSPGMIQAHTDKLNKWEPKLNENRI